MAESVDPRASEVEDPGGRLHPLISAVVLARDEEHMLPGCLEGLRWADELMVLLDAATTDRSASIARQYGAIVHEREFTNFAEQREAALRLAAGEWVLFVDADERVSPELAAEVREVVAAPQGRDAFWIPRRNVILGRVVRHAGWWPDEQLRLLRREGARYDPARLVHELALLETPAGHLRHPFLHFSYTSLDEFWRKQTAYRRLEVAQLYQQEVRPRLRSFAGRPLREFWWRYVVLQGFREGWLGAALSAMLAAHALLVQVELWQRWRAQRAGTAE